MAEAQEYTVASWNAWENEEGPVRDKYGNFKGSVTFEEDKSEPIDATFKTQPEVGDKKYGVVDLYTTQAGKVRKGFKRADRPEGQQSFGGASTAKKEWTPREDHHEEIKAQWAIGQAMSTFDWKGEEPISLDMVQDRAIHLFAMVDRVKGGSESTNPKATSQTTVTQQTSSASPTAKVSGYEKFKASKPGVTHVNEEEHQDAEMASLVASIDTGTEFNLDDIPF